MGCSTQGGQRYHRERFRRCWASSGPHTSPPCQRGVAPPQGGDGGIPSSEAFWVNGIPHQASPGARFHKGAGRTMCAPTRRRAGRPLIRPCGPPSPLWGEGRARRVVAPHAGDPSPKNSQFSIFNSQFLIPNSSFLILTPISYLNSPLFTLNSQLFAVPSTTRQIPWVSAVVLMSS